MADHVIDTNVLLAACTGHEASPFCDTTHLTKAELLQVLNWLVDFHADSTRQLVLDDAWLILNEYFQHLTESDIGHLVLRDKLGSAKFFSITTDENGHALLPAALSVVIHDKEDRKFVAVALADPMQPSIVNACDTDWAGWVPALTVHGVTVLQLL